MGVRVNASGARAHLRHLQKSMVDDFRSASINSATPFGAMRRQWAKRYEAFVRKRYTVYSRGGGNWPRLSPRTIAARLRKSQWVRDRGGVAVTTSKGRAQRKRIGKMAGGVEILKDTGLTFNALTIGAHGNRLEGIANGIRFGFVHAGRPSKRKGKSPTIAQIAGWHNAGVPSKGLPRRLILATPDQATRAGMTKDAQRAIDRVEAEWKRGRRK